ncbi:MAG: hypothetical protein ACRC33_23845 [Gemmataceae bacterium]
MIFNLTGAVIMIAGLGAGFAVGGLASLFTRSDALPVGLGGVVAMAVMVGGDLWYRLRNHPEWGWWRFIHPLTGGMFAFVPVWMLIVFGPMIILAVNWLNPGTR